MSAEGYNGWTNYETWNIALWLQNDEGYYVAAQQCKNYADVVRLFAQAGITETPDGVSFTDPGLNIEELDAMLAELNS